MGAAELLVCTHIFLMLVLKSFFLALSWLVFIQSAALFSNKVARVLMFQTTVRTVCSTMRGFFLSAVISSYEVVSPLLNSDRRGCVSHRYVFLHCSVRSMSMKACVLSRMKTG